jgi:hypothetical protein
LSIVTLLSKRNAKGNCFAINYLEEVEGQKLSGSGQIV